MWAGCLKAGVHPTIAGVILGLMTPVRTWYDEGDFLAAAARAIDPFRLRVEGRHAPHDFVTPLLDLGEARREVLSPAARPRKLSPPLGFVRNLAPVRIRQRGREPRGYRPHGRGRPERGDRCNVGAPRWGNPSGFLLACWIAIATRLSAPPQGIGWKGIILVGLVAGIGFTMAIFIAGLALEDAMLAVAKLAILAASVLAGLAALIFGRFAFAALPGQPPRLPEKLRSHQVRLEAEPASLLGALDVPIVACDFVLRRPLTKQIGESNRYDVEHAKRNAHGDLAGDLGWRDESPDGEGDEHEPPTKSNELQVVDDTRHGKK